MFTKCNCICIAGPGSPYATIQAVEALSPHIGQIFIFSTPKIAFDAIKAKEITVPINAVIFSDEEANNKTSLMLHNLTEKCGWGAVSVRSGQFFSVTTGETSLFISGEKILTIQEFVDELKIEYESTKSKETANA